MEESGREVAAKGEELGSTVEEGEEAALALDILGAEPQPPWPWAKHPLTEASNPTVATPEGPLPL